MKTFPRLFTSPIIAATFAMLAFSCGDPHTVIGPSNTGLAIHGQVLDYTTSAGVAQAVVQFTDVNTHLAVAPDVMTDLRGNYSFAVPRFGIFAVSVNGIAVGTVHARGFGDRGDVFIGRGPCISRYGIVADAQTSRPVSGAVIDWSGTGTSATGTDGWYRMDLSCAGTIGFDSPFISIRHPKYVPHRIPLGPGVRGIERLDVDLQPAMR